MESTTFCCFLIIQIVLFAVAAHSQVAPTITRANVNTPKHAVGMQVRLDCTASGNPTPNVTWYDQNGAKVEGQMYTALPNLGLATSIFTATLQNGGPYECRATNGVKDGSGNVITRTSVVNVVITGPSTSVIPTSTPAIKPSPSVLSTSQETHIEKSSTGGVVMVTSQTSTQFLVNLQSTATTVEVTKETVTMTKKPTLTVTKATPQPTTNGNIVGSDASRINHRSVIDIIIGFIILAVVM